MGRRSNAAALERGGMMDFGKLLERVIAQNQIIICQNEKLLLLLAARGHEQDAELLAELKNLNNRFQDDASTT
jgi:hypothetical protein